MRIFINAFKNRWYGIWRFSSPYTKDLVCSLRCTYLDVSTSLPQTQLKIGDSVMDSKAQMPA